ncbi:unnamed protein product [Brassica rapa subsp. trilocularis]
MDCKLSETTSEQSGSTPSQTTNFISKTDPDTLSALNRGKAGGDMSPDMFKTASSMIGKMSPEEIQKMVQTASSFKGDIPGENGFAPTPDMLITCV